MCGTKRSAGEAGVEGGEPETKRVTGLCRGHPANKRPAQTHKKCGRCDSWSCASCMWSNNLTDGCGWCKGKEEYDGGLCKGHPASDGWRFAYKRCRRCGEWKCRSCEWDDDVIIGCEWCGKKAEYDVCEAEDHEHDYGGTNCTTRRVPIAWRGDGPKTLRRCWNCKVSCGSCKKDRFTKKCCMCRLQTCIECVGAHKDVRESEDMPEVAVGADPVFTCKMCVEYLEKRQE